MGATSAPPAVVILAAGAGTRLAADRSRVPKPLINVLGSSLLARTLEATCEAGLERAVVVTGYCADQVEAHARSHAVSLPLTLEVVRNERWQGGNGSSVLAAEMAVGDRFLVTMADHLVPSPFLRCLISGEHADAAGLLVVDHQLDRVHDLSEATKVRLDGTRITAIGKQIDPFDAADTGVFSFDRRIFDVLRTEAAAGRADLSGAVQRLADQCLMYAVTSDGSFWCDVDTPDDLAYVSGIIELGLPRARPAAARPAALASG